MLFTLVNRHTILPLIHIRLRNLKAFQCHGSPHRIFYLRLEHSPQLSTTNQMMHPALRLFRLRNPHLPPSCTSIPSFSHTSTRPCPL